MQKAKQNADEHLKALNQSHADAANSGGLDREKYIIPPHLHDLQEADLPETQRGLVISEIALFRERAAKREREKMKDERDRGYSAGAQGSGAPSGPKQREWGKPQQPEPAQQQQGFGRGPQGYNKPVGFVREQDGVSEDRHLAGKSTKTDEELEGERRDARHRDEENSFRDVSVHSRSHLIIVRLMKMM